MPRRLLSHEVFHLRDRSDDGLYRRSRLSRAPDVLGRAWPAGIFDGPVAERRDTLRPGDGAEGLKPDAINRFTAQFNGRYAGASNAKKVILAKAKRSGRASAYRQKCRGAAIAPFTVAEIARLFRVPPPLLQDYSFSTFTNAAQADLWFARTSLQPWARKIEAEFARSVFGDPTGRFHVEISFSAVTRGDYATRWAANVAAVGAGVLTADEVREAEGFRSASSRPGAGGPVTARRVTAAEAAVRCRLTVRRFKARVRSGMLPGPLPIRRCLGISTPSIGGLTSSPGLPRRCRATLPTRSKQCWRRSDVARLELKYCKRQLRERRRKDGTTWRRERYRYYRRPGAPDDGTAIPRRRAIRSFMRRCGCSMTGPKSSPPEHTPGTFAHLVMAYRASPDFTSLRNKTRQDYSQSSLASSLCLARPGARDRPRGGVHDTR